MFTTPAPSPSGTLSPATTSSSRASRLRDLINIRNYAYNHLSSRDSSSISHRNDHRNDNLTRHQSRENTKKRNSVAGPADPSTPSASTLTSSIRSHNLLRTRSHTVASTHHNEASPSGPLGDDGNDDDDDDDLQGSLTEVTRARTTDNIFSRQETDQPSAGPSGNPAELFSRSRSRALPDQEHDSGSDELHPQTEMGMTRTRSATTGDSTPEMLPSIRLSTFYDPRSTRPSLSFSPMSRTLPTGKEVIKVGRYSEREIHAPVPANAPSAAPVGFKSKVVSRRHCEFWFEKGKWYIKDVKSSSGTFLNHIRLSAPGTESKPFPINDGDLVQLGIDFKGGEEMIYRCVKMRIELNRGWQAKPNNFNVATHKRLRNMTSAASTASHAQDCSICLNAIAPCQSLFVAPCSHTWHYKCIREMLIGPSAPIFICPNCRAAADLDAEVDEPSDEWQQLESGIDDVPEENSQLPAPPTTNGSTPSPAAFLNSDKPTPELSPNGGDIGDATVLIDHPPQERETPSRPSASDPVPIPNSTNRTTMVAPSIALSPSPRGTRTPSPETNNAGVTITEGPLTPRNDAGPWVFDGNPARVSQESTRRPGMSSLDAAAQAGIQ